MTALSEDFRRHVFLVRTWGDFIEAERLAYRDVATESYSLCRKAAQKGNPLAFNQWERWIQFWTPIRLTQ